MVAERIIPSGMAGVRTQPGEVIRSFIFNFSYGGLQATILFADCAEQGLLVNGKFKIKYDEAGP
jgi:hypothetical protein